LTSFCFNSVWNRVCFLKKLFSYWITMFTFGYLYRSYLSIFSVLGCLD